MARIAKICGRTLHIMSHWKTTWLYRRRIFWLDFRPYPSCLVINLLGFEFALLSRPTQNDTPRQAALRRMVEIDEEIGLDEDPQHKRGGA